MGKAGEDVLSFDFTRVVPLAKLEDGGLLEDSALMPFVGNTSLALKLRTRE